MLFNQMIKVLLDRLTLKHVVNWLLDTWSDEVQLLGACPGGGDFAGGPGGGTPVESFAGVDDVVECADCFFDWGVAVGTVGVAATMSVARKRAARI